MGEKNSSLYKIIREKILELQRKAKFECLQCKKSCCTRNIERIPLLKGDYELLLNNEADLGGVKLYETGQCHLLRLYKKNHCYYYDKKEGLCTIHEIKPLYCFAFPFDFKLVNMTFQGKPVNLLRSIYFPNSYCTWVEEEYKKQNLDQSLAEEVRDLIRQYVLEQ
ncbi:MAG: YkgJ family cysteine cluster protein [Promethearchaeia archaeon]